jgi:hypothetical protein
VLAMKKTSTMLFDIWMADGRRYRRPRAIDRRPTERRPPAFRRDERVASIDPWA